ncbi:MAG: hypothetical protein O7F76_05815 [Planctomycetota bacterium]|nr:hypothetical protein [Planctomycetota bacterium]
MRPLFAAVGLVIAGAVFVEAGPATRPAEPTTTRPTADESVIGRSIAPLVRNLASPRYAVRQAAQRRLELIGDAATPFLLRYVSDPNPEIAGRIVALIQDPREPKHRVELAWRLLCTTNPDWMERAVHTIFEEPAETCELFMACAEDATGIDRVVAGPIVDWLARWKEEEERFMPKYEEIRQADPVAAARLLSMHTDGRMYMAEAAYWESLEALLDHRTQNDKVNSTARASTRPTTRSAP